MNLEKYRVNAPFSLSSVLPSDVQDLDKTAAKTKLAANLERIDELQEKLYAENKQSLLIVIQAMDAGGKDSSIKAITKGLNPQGVRVSSFKAPTSLELAHDFLWRVHQQVPPKGYIQIFNRSHYEEVLIVRVKGWASPELTEKCYQHINDFERLLTDSGTHILKFMLHISPEYQLEQFKERVEDPTKHWKFNPADLEERKSWTKYMESFELLLNKCSPENAPWYVIPAEHKWFRSLAISEIILKKLEEMNPQFPEPAFDVKNVKLG
jgi:PPK2 family polyphosphate:nucleotide phosphotransferase